MFTFQIERGKARGSRDVINICQSFRGSLESLKAYQQFLSSSSWSEPNLSATPSCKGGWKIFFNPRILMLGIKFEFYI